MGLSVVDQSPVSPKSISLPDLTSSHAGPSALLGQTLTTMPKPIAEVLKVVHQAKCSLIKVRHRKILWSLNIVFVNGYIESLSV
jgi:hypothetical protein